MSELHPTRREALGRLGATAAAFVAGAAHAIEPSPRKGPSRVKLGVCAYSYRQLLTRKEDPMTLEAFLEKAAELDFEGVELTSYYFQDTSPGFLRRLRARAFALGLDVAGTSVGNNFCLPPGPARDKQIEMVKKWVEHSETLGAPVIRIFAGSKPKDQTDDDTHKVLVDTIEECCAYAGQHGIFLALENHGGPTATAEGTLKILRDVKSPWFGANLDTGNYHSADPYAEIAAVAPYAITTHVKVEVSAAGQKPQPADFPRIVRILRKAGYRGYLSIEYEAKEDPLTALPRHVKAIREAMRET
ncbi:MAG TPA: sugar phosphate isomerase/epimerase family protein [Planctomycetota bacterium]|nr:sugar phosphate isomerase/epimerase family protein [Planctomycetota bacterium]HRR79252.1 sugar phosphate isomerase/epimerase family protein [Planctomycetota bacterium]HRT94022.1 sugar phosphate isomerase/epimerase family protein [Planctomycetota bacterium]